MGYRKLKKPILVNFDNDIMEYCQLRYYDDGSRTGGDSGEKCRSRSKGKDEPYCSPHDCPLCECPTLHEIKMYDKDYCQQIRKLIIDYGGDIKDFEGIQPNQLPCATYGSEFVIQYYEVS